MQLTPHRFRFGPEVSLEYRFGLGHDAKPVFLPIDTVFEVGSLGATNDVSRLGSADGENVCAEDDGEGVWRDGAGWVAEGDRELFDGTES